MKSPLFFIDSHAHLTSEALFGDVDGIVERAKAAGMAAVVNICTDIVTLERGLALSQQYPFVYNAAATTPHDVASEGEDVFPIMEKHAKAGHLVAVGETGLDYHYKHSPPDIQKTFLRRYFQLALSCNLPVIIHCRDAFEDFFNILDAEYCVGGKHGPGVLHCFTGTEAEAKNVVERGWFLSLSGIITFKKSDALRNVAKQVPLEQLLIETDAPYLSPQSHRGMINEPSFIIETAAVIAAVKEIPVEDVIKTTASNAQRLFKFKFPTIASLLTLCIFLFLSIGSPCFSAGPNASVRDPEELLNTEISRIDTLILATQQSLEGQKKLRELVAEYKKTQETYLKHPQDNDLLLKLVKSAHRTLEAIKENHLIQTFDPEFINELTVLSQAASKRGIPKS